MNPWPFDQPKNCAVFTTTHVMRNGADIIYVYHDEDDDGWQFHYAGETKTEDMMIVSLEEIVDYDSSVLDVAGIPPGWKAWRERRGASWQIEKNKGNG